MGQFYGNHEMLIDYEWFQNVELIKEVSLN